MDDHVQRVGETLIPADLKEQRPYESVRTVTEMSPNVIWTMVGC